MLARDPHAACARRQLCSGPDASLAPSTGESCSKWGYYYTADWAVDTGGQPHEVKEHTAANLRKQTAETRGFLGPHLRLYQIHR